MVGNFHDRSKDIFVGVEYEDLGESLIDPHVVGRSVDAFVYELVEVRERVFIFYFLRYLPFRFESNKILCV